MATRSAKKFTAVQDKARIAVSEFRRMEPALTAFAKHLTSNPKMRVILGTGVPKTDGKVISYPPPIELGEQHKHDRALCDRRDPLTWQQRCLACKVREGIMASIYHEIAHIAFESFLAPDTLRLADTVRYVRTISSRRYAERIERKIASHPILPKSYMALAGVINPYFQQLYNCMEDVRINTQMHTARPGTKAMMDAQILSVMADGITHPDGTTTKWIEFHPNKQANIGAYLIASGVEPQAGWLSDEVLAAIKDHELHQLLVAIPTLPTVHETFEGSWRVFTRLRELGFFELKEEQDDASDEDDEEDESEAPPPPTPPQSSDDSESDSDEESDASDSGDAGEASPSDGDEGAPEEAQSDGEGEQPEEASDDPTDGSDPGEEGGSESEADGESEGDASGGDDDESSELPDQEEADGESAEDEGADGTDTEPAEPGDGDEVEGDAELGDDSSEDGEDGDAESDADSEGPDSDEGAEVGDGGDDDAESGSGDDDGDSGDGDEADSSEADEGGSGEDLAEQDSSNASSGGDGDADSDGGDAESDGEEEASEFEAGEPIEVEPDEDAEEDTGLEGLGLHVHNEEPTGQEEKAIEVAIIQGEYFEKPSANIAGVNEWRYDTVEDDSRLRPYHAWDHRLTDSHRENSPLFSIETPDETIMTPALTRMRVVFAENKRTHRDRNRRSGRIDARVLGKRAWGDDDRLFGKKVVPGRRDYVVVIAIDVSGSTAGSGTRKGPPNLQLIKQAAMAQAELCQRAGIPFAVYAHTGSPTAPKDDGRGWVDDDGDDLCLDIYHIKDLDEAWDDKARLRLSDIGPSYYNLDGHSIEFYRRTIERHPATDKIILYYSDGAMPYENYHEELEILKREIATCTQRGIILMGVGIRTDSPRKHGLDTVQVNDSADIGKVVSHLERRLLV